VFCDGLDIPMVMRLYQHFHGRCQLALGVGTNLTNDAGPEPLQIVIKMVRCNGQPVAKISDSPGKNMCDDSAYVAYLRQVFEIPVDPEALPC
ncbi:nicotinate phosphoribosyltransferase, partial [Salmonella enterica subsp. enterica serovar Oranienburg]|nr:nicotinate phosphoribosyltransferase [Salmonella enterica subsp. enterica serovar Oranienburg]